MLDILKTKTMKYKHIIFLIFCIFFANSTDFKQVTLTEGNYINSFKDQNITKFKVQKTNDFNYLKVHVEGLSNGLLGNNNDTNHIISYYDNANLVERKQLSQSLTYMTIMWLTKEQIKKDFYLTIECAQAPCDFKLELKGSNTLDIYLDEQYTYYVTKENKVMNFSIFNNKEPQELNPNYEYLVTIWARGNKQIESKLEGGEFQKPSEYSYYRVKNNDFANNNYNLIINGTIGDLINIGLILFRKENDNIYSYENKLENGVEITGFVSYNEQQRFEMKDHSFFGYYYDFNNKPIFFDSEMSYYSVSKYLNEIDGSFYSFQHLFDTKYNGKGNNIYSPLLDGIYYYEKIQEGTTIGLIPMKPVDDFNHLTYEVFRYRGEIEVSIYNCENYPLCHLNDDKIEKSTKINDYKSYYYTYNKAEWKIISPISKKQNMLLIKCNKGIVDEEDESKRICISNINMKTDKKVVNNTEFEEIFLSHPRFIRKNNEDKYLFKGKENEDYYLYIEALSGNIKITINPELKPILEKDNKYLFFITKNKDITVTIKGSENAVYRIYDNEVINQLKIFQIGYNYLFFIDDDEIQLSPGVYANDDEYNYYIGIHYLNCSVNVEMSRGGGGITTKDYINKTKDFCQDTSNNFLIDYNLTLKRNNSEGSCPVFISIYRLETLNSNSNGIPLAFKNSYSFLFNVQNEYSMLFSLPYTQKEKDVKIDFKLLTGKNYTVKFMLNNNTLKEEKNLQLNKTIQLKSDEIKKNCKNSQFICKILLEVKSEDKKELVLKITPNIIIPKSNTSDSNSLNKKALIISGCIAFLLIVIIIVIVIILCKFNNKNKDLAEKVNKISFQTDNKDDDDEDGGETLI